MHRKIFINWGLARTHFSINTTPKTFRTVAADLLITVLVTSLMLEVRRVFWKFITLIFILWSCREITGIYKATKTKFVLFTNLILRNLTLRLILLGFIDTRDLADPHLQSDCDISASCCPFPAEPCCLCSFTQTHPFRTSVLFLLEMRNMYQMQKDVSFITCCSCLSVSQLKTDKQTV